MHQPLVLQASTIARSAPPLARQRNRRQVGTALMPLRTVVEDGYHVWRLGEVTADTAPEPFDAAAPLPNWAQALIIGGLSGLSWIVLLAAALAPWWLTALALFAASAWL